MAAEIARLQAEVRRLQADAEVTRRMTAPKQTIRVAGLSIVVVVVFANLGALGADRLSAVGLSECRARNESLSLSLRDHLRELARERSVSAALQTMLTDVRERNERLGAEHECFRPGPSAVKRAPRDQL